MLGSPGLPIEMRQRRRPVRAPSPVYPECRHSTPAASFQVIETPHAHQDARHRAQASCPRPLAGVPGMPSLDPSCVVSGDRDTARPPRRTSQRAQTGHVVAHRVNPSPRASILIAEHRQGPSQRDAEAPPIAASSTRITRRAQTRTAARRPSTVAVCSRNVDSLGRAHCPYR
jgi:hypothetical protein